MLEEALVKSWPTSASGYPEISLRTSDFYLSEDLCLFFFLARKRSPSRPVTDSLPCDKLSLCLLGDGFGFCLEAATLKLLELV